MLLHQPAKRADGEEMKQTFIKHGRKRHEETALGHQQQGRRQTVSYIKQEGGGDRQTPGRCGKNTHTRLIYINKHQFPLTVGVRLQIFVEPWGPAESQEREVSRRTSWVLVYLSV